MSDRPQPDDEDDDRPPVPLHVYRLGEEPADDLLGSTTPEERLAMVWELTKRAWELSGRPIPKYERHEAPVVIRRRHER